MAQEGKPKPESPHVLVNSSPTQQRVVPGGTAIYAIAIENRSDEAQAQSLDLQELPREWYTLEFDEARVAFPGEQRSATLIISVPEDIQPSSHTFRVVARAGSEESAVLCSLEVIGAAPTQAEPEPEVKTQAEIRAVPPPMPGVSVSPALVTWEGELGAEEWLTITVWNTGSEEIEYSISLEGLAPDWCTVPPKLRVPGGESIDTRLQFHPPARTRSGDYPFKVRVAVDEYPNVAAEAQGRLRIAEREAVVLPRPTPVKEKPEEAVPRTPVLPPEVSLAPRTQFRFGPGEVSAQAVITVENKSRLIERYEIQVLGIPEEWYGLATTELRLDSGGSAQVPLRITPRPGPGYPAGEYSFRVRVAPHRSPESFAEVGALITIVGVPAFDARLTPAQAQGRKEEFTLSLLNTGAVRLNLRMEGSDLERKCRFKFPAPPNLDPGQAAVVPVEVGARRIGLLGPPETFDFRLHVVPDGAESTAGQTFDARLVHQPLLSFRLAFLSLFVALLVLIVGLVVFVGSPAIGDAFTWVGCRVDSDYRPAKNQAPIKKPECGGPSRDEQLSRGAERIPAAIALARLQSGQNLSLVVASRPEPGAWVKAASSGVNPKREPKGEDHLRLPLLISRVTLTPLKVM